MDPAAELWGTRPDEFYRPMFRRKIFASVDDLQVELDDWLQRYNGDRTHQGKRCQGRTPMATFTDSLDLARKANLTNEEKPAA